MFLYFAEKLLLSSTPVTLIKKMIKGDQNGDFGLQKKGKCICKLTALLWCLVLTVQSIWCIHTYVHACIFYIFRNGFLVTASCDGHVKFWKKSNEKGIEFVKHFRSHLGKSIWSAICVFKKTVLKVFCSKVSLSWLMWPVCFLRHTFSLRNI